MELQTKITYWLVAAGFGGAILHNLFYGLTGIEEPVFFMIGIIGLFCFPFSVLYNIITYIRNKKPKDIWKLGWLGILGVLGTLVTFSGGFSLYVLFAFFAFFGLKK